MPSRTVGGARLRYKTVTGSTVGGNAPSLSSSHSTAAIAAATGLGNPQHQRDGHAPTDSWRAGMRVAAGPRLPSSSGLRSSAG